MYDYLTFILQVAFTPLPSFAVAVIVTVPFFSPVTLPEVDTLAILLLELVHVTPFTDGLLGAYFLTDNFTVFLRLIVALFLFSVIFVIFLAAFVLVFSAEDTCLA